MYEAFPDTDSCFTHSNTGVNGFIRIHVRGEAKPCMNALSEVGSCMFTWECIKLEGHRLGTCADGFLFGVCCRTKHRFGSEVEPVTTLMASSTPAYFYSTSSFIPYPSMSTKSAKFVNEAVSGSSSSLNSFNRVTSSTASYPEIGSYQVSSFTLIASCLCVIQ